VDLDLRDKVVVVTGASQGIGLAVVRAFAQEGAKVIAGARRSSAVRACRAALPALISRGSGAIVNLASVNSL
jgi:NAD(P)-dependent dehydrogenase (short-subunit alcohol dehydrogenase family)